MNQEVVEDTHKGILLSRKRNEVLIHATVEMNIRLSERKQAPKFPYCMILCIGNVQKR